MSMILVVDDYVVTQRVLSAQLRKGGYATMIASSGKEALHHLGSRAFDLAIIDIAMPDMDGITLLQQLRNQPPHRTLPVIILTASALDTDRIRAQAAGANEFLTKPLSSWELWDAVHRQLRR